jgi:epsilon-lactone hydrolase
MKTLVAVLSISVFAASGASTAAVAQGSAETPRRVPARVIPVPSTVSPPMQKIIAVPPEETSAPKTPAEWKALIAAGAPAGLARIDSLKKQFDVAVEPRLIGNVPCFVITPKVIPERNRKRLLLNVHGGAYVFGSGEGGAMEGVLMAAHAHMKVIAVDYRMAPDFPYPAAMDDAMAVWREVVKLAKPANTAIFGTSTGGGMTLAMVQRAIKEGLPLPAAIAPGTPWSDLSKTGDSYFTNESIDNVIVRYDGLLSAAAKLYANGLDMQDPRLSPVYGDFHGFPPTILTTGTRDLFLSNTVRVHRKLREAGVVAQLEVYEGQSHAQYLPDPAAPESKEVFEEISKFFDEHLGRR